MIADNCQIGILFGGHRFILFFINDTIVAGVSQHHMACSSILDTVPQPGQNTPSAMQICIAALLGGKDDLPSQFGNTGITVGTREEQVWKRSMRSGPSGNSRSRSQVAGKSSAKTKSPRPSSKNVPVHTSDVSNVRVFSCPCPKDVRFLTMQQLTITYDVAPQAQYFFERVVRECLHCLSNFADLLLTLR